MKTIHAVFIPEDDGEDVVATFPIPRQTVQGTHTYSILTKSGGQLGSYQMNSFRCAPDCKCGGVAYERPAFGNHHPMLDLFPDVSSDPFTWFPGMETSDGITRLQS